jgi:hypothetical protein
LGFFFRNSGVLLSTPKLKGGTSILIPPYFAAMRAFAARLPPGYVRSFYTKGKNSGLMMNFCRRVMDAYERHERRKNEGAPKQALDA